MPNFCGVINCGNRANRDRKSFYRLPGIPKRASEERIKLSDDRRKRWIAALKRDDLSAKKIMYLRICEDHFISGKPSALMDTDNPDWVPSKNMGYMTNSYGSAFDRYERRKKRKLNNIINFPSNEGNNIASEDDHSTLEHENLAPADDHPTSEHDDPASEHENPASADDDNVSNDIKSVCVQTDLTMKDIDMLNEVYQDVQTQLINAKRRLKTVTLDETSFKDNNEKVKYYTGIPDFVTLMIIFKLVKPFITETFWSSLTKFQKFLLTMMHLRLNLDFTDLGYRFGNTKSTASRIFSECLYVLHERLHNMVFWPEREELRAKVPLSFLETFGRKVTVIIDCFEIKIEKPQNLLACAQCYSHYKHSYTIKYLIGISPQGVIIFISSAWGGRTSDKHIVQNSSFLSKLLPGDLVLADRGFNVKKEVGLYCAELKLPAYTKGKKQLNAVDIEDTRNLAHVRIHVERVIGQLRNKFRILNDVMPITLVSKTNLHSPATVDQIVMVCCALLNLMPSVIPFE